MRQEGAELFCIDLGVQALKPGEMYYANYFKHVTRPPAGAQACSCIVFWCDCIFSLLPFIPCAFPSNQMGEGGGRGAWVPYIVGIH